LEWPQPFRRRADQPGAGSAHRAVVAAVPHRQARTRRARLLDARRAERRSHTPEA
jgi:hypothetical protein